MPPNEKCPICKAVVPDWHREWHTKEDQTKLYNGAASMECPLCGAAVLHARWQTPLLAAPAEGIAKKVKRDVLQAAYWSINCNCKPLVDYLKMPQGLPYGRYWSAAEVQQADQSIGDNTPQP
jgi:hypothetical protein